MINLGGNKISELKLRSNQTLLSKNKYYFYYHLKLEKNKNFLLPKDVNFTIYVLNCGLKTSIKLDNKVISINKNICLYFKKYHKIESLNGDAEILIVGKKIKNNKNFYLKKKISKFYKVNKPWGSELWINSINNDFVFKKIFLKKGFQTSLQFHNYKEEANLIFEGKAKFFYKKDKKINNLKVKVKDLGFLKIKRKTIINISPKILHRIKAITNLVMYEASSVHLKDVVRVLDDSKRLSGHIANEHIKKSK